MAWMPVNIVLVEPVTNWIQGGNCVLLADTCSILNRRENHLCHLLNLCWFNGVRWTEIHDS
jgi:hypothetical protein